MMRSLSQEENRPSECGRPKKGSDKACRICMLLPARSCNNGEGMREFPDQRKAAPIRGLERPADWLKGGGGTPAGTQIIPGRNVGSRQIDVPAIFFALQRPGPAPICQSGISSLGWGNAFLLALLANADLARGLRLDNRRYCRGDAGCDCWL